MQIKSTKDIRDYQEVVYFGLSLRQLVCAALAILAAGSCYFLFRERLPGEVVSWISIVAAVPFAAFGFVKWHGMNMEQLIPMWYRSLFCLNRTIYYRPENMAALLVSEYLKESTEKEDKNAKNRKKRKSKA